MSYHVAIEQAAKSAEAIHPCQPLWMAHWMQSKCVPTLQLHEHDNVNDDGDKDHPIIKQSRINQVSQSSGSRKRPASSAGGSDYPESSAKNFKSRRDTSNIEETSESSWMEGNTGSPVVQGDTPYTREARLNNISLSKLSKSSLDVEHFTEASMLHSCPKTRKWTQLSMVGPNDNVSSELSSGTNLPIFNCDSTASHNDGKWELFANDAGLLKEHCFQVESQRLETKETRCKKYLPASWRSVEDRFRSSTSTTVLHNFEPTGLNTWSTSRKEDGFNTISHSEHLTGNYNSSSMLDMKTDRRLLDQCSQSNSMRQTDDSLSLSEYQRFASVEAKQGNNSKLFGARLLPNLRNDPGVSRFNSLTGDCVNLHRMTECSMRDTQTLQICTTVKSVETVLGAPPKFSKTTHNVLVTKKTDMNVSHRSQMIRESSVSTQENGNSFHGMLAPPSVFGGKEERVHLVTSSHDDKGKDYATVVNFVDLHKGSSIETDAMPFDSYKPRNPSAGGISSKHKYATRVQAIQNDHTTIMSLAELPAVRIRQTELPDINEEPPTSLIASSSFENRALSESRTESLNAEHLIFHAKQREENSSSCPQLGTLPATESCSRWVMRFRLSASDSHAIGSKSWKPGDDSRSKNVNKLLNRIMNYRKTSSESTLGFHFGKKAEQLDKSATSLKNKESSSAETVKDNEEISLSHPWIQRWRRHDVSLQIMKPPVEVVCEPESSRIALEEEFQMKQYPSIAAMALMGKAVNNLQPCEFRKRGPVVVWKT